MGNRLPLPLILHSSHRLPIYYCTSSSKTSGTQSGCLGTLFWWVPREELLKDIQIVSVWSLRPNFECSKGSADPHLRKIRGSSRIGSSVRWILERGNSRHVAQFNQNLGKTLLSHREDQIARVFCSVANRWEPIEAPTESLGRGFKGEDPRGFTHLVLGSLVVSKRKRKDSAPWMRVGSAEP